MSKHKGEGEGVERECAGRDGKDRDMRTKRPLGSEATSAGVYKGEFRTTTKTPREADVPCDQKKVCERWPKGRIVRSISLIELMEECDSEKQTIL